jgi:threonine dehydratase
LGESREAVLAVTLDEKPGSFRRFSKILARRSVTEFNYRFGDTAAAKILVGVEIANQRVFRFEFPERPSAGQPTSW